MGPHGAESGASRGALQKAYLQIISADASPWQAYFRVLFIGG